jgi:hypothetical protein
MSGMALAVTLVVAVAVAVTVVLTLLTLSLSRQVHRLRREVQGLAQTRGSTPDSPAVSPVVSQPPHGGDLVVTPTLLGPLEAEPDLRMSRIGSVTLAGPLIKVAALSSGLRRALSEDARMRASHAFRKELRRQRKQRRKRSAAGSSRPAGRRP